MSFIIADRRPNGKGKSLNNREKFLKRIKDSIKDSLGEILNSKGLKEAGSTGGDVRIKRKGIDEPNFRHGDGGIRESVRPGNKEFNTGDKFLKPPKGGNGRGQKGSPDGEGVDDFIIEISRDEFLQYFFEDLELPDMIKESMAQSEEEIRHNAGYTTVGSPAKLDERRSLRNSHSRRIATRSPYKKRLAKVEKEYEELMEALEVVDSVYDKELYEKLMLQRDELIKKINGLKAKIAHVPFLDPTDLRYHSTVIEKKPITSAVMICIQDNSGSMGEHEKTLARKFFTLLYLFLAKNYEKVALRFIFHTSYAKEVDEQEFFNTQESGGTVVSTALDLAAEIINKDYSDGKTNVYVCQASDGDNYSADNELCYKLMCEKILPFVQYYAYVEVGGSEHSDVSDLWPTYVDLQNEHQNFQMSKVHESQEIYPVFRKLFEKR